MAMHIPQRYRRSGGRIGGKIVVAGLVFACLFAAISWVFSEFFATREGFPVRRDDQTQGALVFEYTVTTEPGHIRVNGMADLPNGVILVGTLDRVGSGPIDVKEALVMNR